MNAKETQKAKQLLKKYFTLKKVYYRTRNENLYKASEKLLKEATLNLISAANRGDHEAQKILTQLDAKNHIVLNISQKRPWYYYVLWVIFIAYLLFFFMFMGQQLLTKSATPTPSSYSYEVDVKKSDVPSTTEDDDGTEQTQYDYPLHEPLLIIRNALYRYVLKTGTFPEQLNDLTKGYPYNYLHTIPLNPVSGTNDVYTTYTNKGGWYYNPNPNPDLPLQQQIVESVQPNAGPTNQNYFSPLTIKISLADKQLYLADDNYIYHQFPIAIGENNASPVGEYYVAQKLTTPREDIPLQDNPYGTRLLELSNEDYAIHGTNDNSSIGNAVTNGCIRLTNADIQLLFAMTPLETPIQIANNQNELWNDLTPTQWQPQFIDQPNALHDYLSNPDNPNTPDAIKPLLDNINAIYQTDKAPVTNPDYISDNKKEWRN
ncbi:MAG TPA: hypothetical protein DCY20_00170 [Firmicutes bacterium]|nr:hypothetical protein [Bacillota bacterium]